ncbi:uncharacterized protein LOC144684251 [Cetorhinus maximus]
MKISKRPVETNCRPSDWILAMMFRSNKRPCHNKLTLESRYYRATKYPTSQDAATSLCPLKNLSSSKPVGRPSRMLVSMRQLSILDKKTILSENNERLSEDLTWISGLESVGSLRTGDPNGELKKRRSCSKDKFRKGLASRSLKNTNVLPLVNGSKYFACDPCVLQSRLV